MHWELTKLKNWVTQNCADWRRYFLIIDTIRCHLSQAVSYAYGLKIDNACNTINCLAFLMVLLCIRANRQDRVWLPFLFESLYSNGLSRITIIFRLPVSECICVSPIKHCGCHASLSHRKLSWRSQNLYVYIIHLFVMFAVGLLCVHVILLYLYLLSFVHLNSTKKKCWLCRKTFVCMFFVFSMSIGASTRHFCCSCIISRLLS